MKVCDSGMPEEKLWASFFNPQKILSCLKLSPKSGDVVEFGCGYGTFTTEAAKMTLGKVFALDIEAKMLACTQKKARRLRLKNIFPLQCDFTTPPLPFKPETIGYVMLFNILHHKNPLVLLKESYRILKPKGKAAIIHWNYDPKTPRGPAMDIRPKSEDCLKWLKTAGFKAVLPFAALPLYHYGLLGEK